VKKKIEDIGGGVLRSLYFFQNIKPTSIGELKNLLEESFGGVERVYVNSSNLIYVVIIFLKLKIY